MSVLSINGSGAYERDTEQNWAAAYAKRLADEESEARESADATLQDNITAEAGARASSDTALEGSIIALTATVEAHHRTDSAAAAAAQQTADGAASAAAAAQQTADGAASAAAAAQQTADGAASAAAAAQQTADGAASAAAAAQQTADGKLSTLPAATDAEVVSGAITSKAVTPATLKGELDRRSTYGTVPQQIGTWTDGTPVWRAAVYTESVDDKYTGSYKFGHIDAQDLGVRSLQSVSLLLSVNTICRRGNYFGTCRLTGQLILSNGISTSIRRYVLSCDNSSIDFEDSENLMTISGCIEFVTPATNIITG